MEKYPKGLTGVNCPPMSLNHKSIPAASDGTPPMSFTKKSLMGDDSRPPQFRPESTFSKNK